MPKPMAPRPRIEERLLSPAAPPTEVPGPVSGQGQVTARGSYSHCFGILSASLSSAIT